MTALNAKTLKRPRNPGYVDAVVQKPVFGSLTQSLLHFNGEDESIDFYDELATKLWTRAGTAKIDTAQSMFGGAGGFFNGGSGGSIDYIATASDNADFAFGTGDFSFEFFMRPASLPGTNNIFLIDFRDALTTGYLSLNIDTAGKLVYQEAAIARITGATTIVINTWYHVAVARSAGVTKMFLGGVQQGASYTDATNYLVGSNRPFIGGRGYLIPQAVGFYFNGWIDEFRLCKGIARWTADFTPPTIEYAPAPQ